MSLSDNIEQKKSKRAKKAQIDDIVCRVADEIANQLIQKKISTKNDNTNNVNKTTLSKKHIDTKTKKSQIKTQNDYNEIEDDEYDEYDDDNGSLNTDKSETKDNNPDIDNNSMTSNDSDITDVIDHINILEENVTINKIYHIADIHMRKLERHDEYRDVFKKLFDFLRNDQEQHDDTLLIICGDILHSNNDLSVQLVELLKDFFMEASKIINIIVIPGNHDVSLIDGNFKDSFSPIITRNFPTIHKIHVISEQGLYKYGNIIFGHTTMFSSKVQTCKVTLDSPHIKIGLYHGTMKSAMTTAGFKFKNEKFNIKHFGDYDIVMLGDIHRYQYLDENLKIAYCGSLIQQNHGESLLDHGVLVWHLDKFPQITSEFVRIPNDYGFVQLTLSSKGLKKYNVNDIPKFPTIKIMYQNITHTEAEQTISQLRKKHNIYNYTLVKDITKSIINVNIGDDTKLENIVTDDHVKKTIINYMKNNKGFNDEKKIDLIGTLIDNILKDNPIKYDNKSKSVKLKELKFDNMFIFGEGNIIDFQKFNRIVVLDGPNFIGKSSIVDIILYAIFGESSRGDKRNIRNIWKNTMTSSITLNVNGKDYTIKRNCRPSSPKTSKRSVKANTIIGHSNSHRDVTEDIKIYENEILISGNKKTNIDEIIEKYFGTYDDYTLINTMLQNDTNNFVIKKPCERKDIVCKLLRLNIFSQLLEEVKSKIRSLTRDINKVKKDIDILVENNFNESENAKSKKKKKNENSNSDREQKFEKQISDLQIQLENLDSQKDDLQNEENQLNRKRMEYGLKIKEFNKIMIIDENDDNDDNDNNNNNDNNDNNNNDNNDNNDNVNNNGKNNGKNKENQQQKINDFKDEIKKYNNKIEKIEQELDETNDNIQNIEKEISKKEKEKINQNNKIKLKESQINNEQTKITKYEEQLKQYLHIEERKKIYDKEKEEKLEKIMCEINELLQNREPDVTKKTDAELQEIIRILKQNITIFNKKLAITKKEIDENNKQIEFHKNEIVQLEKSENLDENYEQLNAKRTQKNELETKIGKIKKDLIKSKQDYEKIKIHKFNPNCNECMSNPVTQNKIYYEETIKRTEEQIKDLSEQIICLTQEIKKAEQNGHESKYHEYYEISKNNDEHEETLKKLSSKYNLLEKDEELLNEKMQSHEKRLKDNEKIIKNKEINKKIDEDVKQLKINITNIKNELFDDYEQYLEIKDAQNITTKNIHDYEKQLLELKMVVSKKNDEINELKENIHELRDEICKFKNLIQKYQTQCDELRQQQEKYEELHKERLKIIKDYEIAQKELKNTNIEYKLIKDRLGDIVRAFNSKNKEKMQIENEYEKYKKLILQVKELEDEMLLCEDLVKILGENGLVDGILTNKIIPELEGHINNILDAMTHYKVQLKYNKNGIEIYKTVDGSNVIIENGKSEDTDSNDSSSSNDKKSSNVKIGVNMLSGYEGKLLNIVIRLALANISNYLKTDFLIIDEAFYCFDEGNRKNINSLFDYIRDNYKWALIISHDDLIKNQNDMKISINQKNKLSKINI